ncbi:hypothetical protein D7X88_12735 [bacterium C-53]|nr:hypothetical protein [Lachnospiraceae bacterium]NBI03880.1 hypothetical protein [Lachnospiraceae bacterium]RKJ09023.1 hypothetical protein D7X88_12735 [bacterium C-53]
MAFKIFLALIVVLALLTAIGANVQENKRLAVAVAITALIVLAVVFLQGESREALEVGQVTADQIEGSV